VTLGEHDEAAREDLGVRHDIGGPVQRVAAVIDSAAALGLVVHRAQKLPLGCAHLGARRLRAGWCIEEETDDQAVTLRDEEAAELVKPERTIDPRGWRGELLGSLAGDGLRVRGAEFIVQSGEVLLKLEGRVELEFSVSKQSSLGRGTTTMPGQQGGTNLIQRY
jgi:hypothetical protein